MERQKSARVNRSKTSLPAAFSTREARQLSPVVRIAEGDTSAYGGHRGDPGQAAGWPVADGASASIRLEALVFLSSCPQRHGHVALKKMLHPPTLRLFCLVEIPGADQLRAVLRASLQGWLRRWSALQAQHPELLVAVCETYWDAPQGYPVGILCEHMPLGSLEDLAQACGGLPEEAMREVAEAVLRALDALHSLQPPLVHGCLKPSQVLFSAGGAPRLAFGLEQRLRGSQGRAAAAAVASASGLGFGGLEAARTGQPSEEMQSPSVDIFDLGLLLLVSALGGLDVLLGAIPHAREFGCGSTKDPSAPLNMVPLDTCALLQRELCGAVATASGGGMSEEGESAGMGYLPAASDILFNREYSEPFLAFVSACLEAHQCPEPVTARDLLRHEFLRGSGSAGPLVSLREMQELARTINEAPEQLPSRLGPARNRNAMPGVGPSIAQSAQLYVSNIAQSIVLHHGPVGPRQGYRPRYAGDADAMAPRWGHAEWDTLVLDTARTLGLQQKVVQGLLDAQLDKLTHRCARERRDRGEPVV